MNGGRGMGIHLPARAWQRIRHRAGRRGGFLAFLAALDYLYGSSLFHIRPTGYHYPLLPQHVWGLAWVTAGTACAVGVFLRRDRIPYTVAVAMKTAWGIVYIDVWLFQQVSRVWVLAAIWLTFALVTAMVSSWPEPTIIAVPMDPEP